MKNTSELQTTNETGQANQPEPLNTGSIYAVEIAEGSRATSHDEGHIGRVVAGCLISGIVAAIALVVTPRRVRFCWSCVLVRRGRGCVGLLC
jgi:hypothetical protein